MAGRRLLQIVGYVILAGMAVAFAQSAVTTASLVRVDSGLHSSLKSTRQLVEINRAIIHNNNSLPQVAAESQQAAQQLQTTLQATSKVEQHIAAINKLNRKTLTVNNEIGRSGTNNAQSLQQLVDSTTTLKASLQQVQANLKSLKAITDADRNYLNSMRRSADTMNKKTPGVG